MFHLQPASPLERNSRAMRSFSMNHAEVLRLYRHVRLWTVPVVFSLVLNTALFELMPCLVDYSPAKSEFSEIITPVNVIRIRRPESPVRKSEKKHEIRSKEEVKKLISKKVYICPMLKQLVNIPFEINPKLPPISGTLPVEPVMKLSSGQLGLKDVFEVGQIDHPLTPIVQIPPLYPMRARSRGIEGWVRVRFIVDEEGRVRDVTIVESHPKKVFDNAVLRCVSRWRFKPGTVEGIRVKTLAETTIRFDLK